MKITKFFLVVGVLGTILFLLIALGPLGTLIFKDFLQLPDDVVVQAKYFILFISPTPLFNTVRCGFHGVATVYKKTVFLYPKQEFG